jgi:hypothetical protein
LVVAAVLLTLAYSAFVLAANPSAVPRIISTANASTANVTSAFATNQLFGYANFTNTNGTFEENSTFKWFKRTLYQPQNRSLIGYWKLDGNANDAFSYRNKIFNWRVRIL